MAALDCKRAVDVEIPAEEVEREASRIARDLQRRARVPGFRPGKAPLSLVRQRYEANIREQVLESMVPAYLRTAFERENLEPISRPAIENLHFKAGEPIRFKASFEVMPEIQLGDYKSLSVPTPAPPEKSAETELEETLQHLREQAAVYEDLGPDARAAEGLTVEASYERRSEGESTSQRVEKRLIDVGASETLPEFSRALEGAAAGETREFDVHYPEDFGHPEVAGKTVHFTLTVQGVKRKVLPELDEAFAKQHGAESVEALKDEILKSIAARRRERSRSEAEHAIAERLLAMHDFPVPEALIAEQARSRMEREARSLADQGIQPKELNVDWKAWQARHEERAAQDVKLALILERIAAAEGISVDDEEVRRELAGLAERLKQPTEAFLRRMAETGFRDRTKTRLRNEKTMDFLLRQSGALGAEAPESQAPPA
ncbi:MAG TPA: trigger factor [Terriglobales bacterium]|nr:trigger factor [Terriglobales bacterium]